MASFVPVPRLLPLLIGVSFLPCGVAASEPEPLMTLVVEGAGESTSPLGVAVDDLDRRRATISDAASLLRDVPGVSLYGAGGVSSLPAIHGLADDRLRVKVDGMDLIAACGNHMNPPLSYIDPSAVVEATVFAGVTPVSVGGDSIGGSIVVESADPEFAATGALLHKGEVGAFYRSNGDAFGGNVAATLASEKLSLSYRGSTAQADDHHAGDSFKPAGPAAAGRGWLDGDEVGSTMYKSTNQSLGLGMRQDGHLVELKVGVQDIPYQGFPNQRMDMTGNESSQVNLRYAGEYDWGKLEARAYNEDTRHAMQFFDDKLYWYGATPAADGIPCVPSGGMTGCAAGMPMDTEGRNSGALVKATVPLSTRDLLRVGGELQQYRLDDWWDPSGKGMWPEVFWNINGGERDRLAAFGEWEARWTPLWMTQVGVRYEKVDMDAGDVQGYNATYDADAAAFNAADREKTDHNLDVTTLARHVPDAGKTFEFGYARKTRSPNLYERYTWSTGGMAMRMINWFGDGNGYVGNVDLEPEIAHTLSATADWHAADARWGFKVTPYATYVDDYINAARLATQPTPDGFVYLRFVNQDALLYGVDVSGHVPLAHSARLGDFTGSAIVGYVRGETVSGEDDKLYNLMPLNAKLAVTQRVGNWRNSAELLLVDAKDDVSDIRNEIETAGYTLLNLRSGYQWKQARVDFGVENVFDRYYEHPLGGAYVGQGKTMSATGVPWGVAVPGTGRSLYTAVTFTF
jgi:iron complex outermembrane receptor protein